MSVGVAAPLNVFMTACGSSDEMARALATIRSIYRGSVSAATPVHVTLSHDGGAPARQLLHRFKQACTNEHCSSC